MSRPCRPPFAATLLLLFAMTTVPATGATTFVVAPDGHDAHPGTADRPFRTLERARDAVRELIAAGLAGDVEVRLRGGTYVLPDGLSLSHLDSGTAEHAVTWASVEGEVARLVGGVRLTDWRPHEGAIAWCPLPEGSAPRRLIENGVSLEVARFPADGYLKTAGAPAGSHTAFRYRAGDFDPTGWDLADGTVLLWPGHPWFSFDKKVVSIDPQTRTITVGDARGYTLRERGGDQYYLRNVLALLDRPGRCQIALSRGRAYVWPRGGDAASREIIATTAETLIRVEAAEGETVRNVHFRDLDLVGANGDLVRFTNAADCSVRLSRLAAAHGNGVHVVGAAERVTLYGNLIEDHGGHGVRLAGLGYNTPDVNHGHVVENNHVRRCGYAEGPGYGVEITWSGHNRVLHNHIHDMPRYGTSIKGTHGGELPAGDPAIEDLGLRLSRNHSRGNLIAFNHIHHVNLESQDTGAMESWGPGRDNVYDHNLIHDTGTPRWDTQQGIYLDDASHGFTVTNNIVYNVHGNGGGLWCVFAKGVDITIDNNILIGRPPVVYGIGSLAMAGQPTSHHRYLRNIFYFTGTAAERAEARAVIAPIDGTWDADRIIESDYSLVWDTSGDPPAFRIGSRWLSWDEWRAMPRGYERHSVIADPLFVDPDNHDYRLRPDSPALKLGFKPIDIDRIGLKADFPARLPRE